ncbi:homoserine O-succinyltransferase [Candidatus Sodalis endolongispinus]|uniref:Homoserine O-succinyltransferase n=1 Tax=Candidatus Sodalis endolongispinus TaxID=2812662 RepID=A0ABS5YB44_9GAMM|nr:homoserine O-succinyltransferase [Candidatus Sodalis endolongispinus]MBT9432168.1 homoserine O-succinyltransferase [Candidatus Sodalis endolongispinus]
MPIRVFDELPAVNFLRNENVFVMTSSRASTQEIRPLKVLILNLMPKKIETENQFLRLLSNSPLQVDIQLLRIDSRESKNTPAEHLNNFYCNFEDIQHDNFDGLVVTGAPLGLVDFRDVVFWPQIDRVLHWARDHVTSTLFVCWAVQAALNILYGIPKMTRQRKLAGVYQHHTQDKRLAFVTGHPEYDALTLASEYHRDRETGLNPMLPVNYFPQDNPDLTPKASWRSHGHLLFANWLNYYVYQITPFDLRRMNPTLE